jgi:arylsulfatase
MEIGIRCHLSREISMSMLRVVFAMLLGLSFAPAVLGQLQLPQADPAFKGKIGETYKDSQPDYPRSIRASQGSPNVLLILLDDVGFGMCSTYGGPVPTPYMEWIAVQ